MSHASSRNHVQVAMSVSQRAYILEYPTDLIEVEYGGDFMDELGRSFFRGRASSVVRTTARVHRAAGFSSSVRTQPHFEYPLCCAGVGAE